MPKYMGRTASVSAYVVVALLASAVPLMAQTVKLVGADPTSGLSFKTAVEDTAILIPLELEGGKEPLKPEGLKAETEGGKHQAEREGGKQAVELRIAVDPFLGPDTRMRPVDVTIDGKPADTPITLTQLDRPVLRIHGSFPDAGEYKSNVVLFYAGKRHSSVALAVTRERDPVSVLIDTVPAVNATAWRTADARIRFVVRETAGREVRIDPPLLVDFGRKDGDRTPKQAVYEDVKIAAVDSAADGTQRMSEATTQPFTLTRQQSREFQLTVSAIAEAGEYNGLIRISSRDSKEVEKPVTVFVRKSGWIAFAFIFLGVFSSWLIRYWTSDRRPKLEGLRRISDLLEDLEKVEQSAGTTPEARNRAFAGMRNILAKAERNLSRGAAKDVPTLLDAIDCRISALPRWLSLGNRLSGVDPSVNVATIVSDWSALADAYFLKPGAKDEDFNTQLQALRKSLDDALRAKVEQQIKELEASIAAYKTAHPAAAQAVDPALAPTLERAREHANAGRLSEATEQLNAAKSKYAAILANELTRALNDPAPPLGFSKAEWAAAGTELRPKVKQIRDAGRPDDAIELYNQVNARYLDLVIGAAQRLVDEQAADVRASTTIPDADRDSLGAELKSIADVLKDARMALSSGDFGAVAAQYQQAANQITTVAGRIAHSGKGQLRSASGLGALAELVSGIPRLFSTEPAAEPTERPPRSRPASERISDLIRRYDLLLNLGVLLIATMLGMKLLWASDPVWGGWTAYTIAFLWGLGLQQVGGAAFEGLPAITKKLTE